jgi:hypothetical protein
MAIKFRAEFQEFLLVFGTLIRKRAAWDGPLRLPLVMLSMTCGVFGAESHSGYADRSCFLG